MGEGEGREMVLRGGIMGILDERMGGVRKGEDGRIEDSHDCRFFAMVYVAL